MTAERAAEGRHVLVVEDEMTIAVMIEDTLEGLGAEVVGPAARLDAALRLAREAPIDAAVLDINIRGGNSYPVAEILAERGIPFVFCSGYGDWALGPVKTFTPPGVAPAPCGRFATRAIWRTSHGHARSSPSAARPDRSR